MYSKGIQLIARVYFPDSTYFPSPECKLPRLRLNGNLWETFGFIPVTYQLLMRNTDPVRSKGFTGYITNGEAENTGNSRVREFYDRKLAVER